MSKKQTEPAKAPAQEQDEHHGHGGAYVVNDKGVRELVERTDKVEKKEVNDAQA